jgi:LDH2 family malate/lactate/ureidoglycolate dehydrogenase
MNIENGRVRMTVPEAQMLAEQSLQGIGYDADEARIIANHVVDAALCGYEYSGLPKILNVAEHPRLKKPRQPLRILRETPVSVLFDGGNNVGMVSVSRATDAAIARASEQGIAIVGLHNSWVSGRGAHYVERIANAGLVGIHTVSSTRHVAPPGASKAATGTNPIAMAFPTERDPLVIDMGVSAFMSTDIHFRIRRGEQLPEGVAIDRDGKPTCDPVEALAGAILPFGGYKGFALGIGMQALGVLAGSGYDAEKIYGYLIIAIKPDLLVPLEEYRRHLTAALDLLKAAPKQPGVTEIRLPSERAFRERERLRREGLEIDEHIYRKLAAYAAVANK